MYLEFLLRRAHSRRRVERMYWSGVSLYSSSYHWMSGWPEVRILMVPAWATEAGAAGYLEGQDRG
jgi:hypothetical protein